MSLHEVSYKPGAKRKTYFVRGIAEHFKERIEFELSDTFKKQKKAPR